MLLVQFALVWYCVSPVTVSCCVWFLWWNWTLINVMLCDCSPHQTNGSRCMWWTQTSSVRVSSWYATTKRSEKTRSSCSRTTCLPWRSTRSKWNGPLCMETPPIRSGHKCWALSRHQPPSTPSSCPRWASISDTVSADLPVMSHRNIVYLYHHT